MLPAPERSTQMTLHVVRFRVLLSSPFYVVTPCRIRSRSYSKTALLSQFHRYDYQPPYELMESVAVWYVNDAGSGHVEISIQELSLMVVLGAMSRCIFFVFSRRRCASGVFSKASFKTEAAALTFFYLDQSHL